MKATTEKDRFNRVTSEKLKEDSKNVCCYARFVLVLSGTKVRVIDNGKRRANNLPFAKIIAIAGAVEFHEELIPEAILVEIGYSRTRPYNRTEKSLPTGYRGLLKSRTRTRGLSDKEVFLVYPYIVKCMEAIIIECRESWTYKNPRWIKGPGYVEIGIRFTFHQSGTRLLQQMFIEDIRYHYEKYLGWHDFCMRRWLRHFRCSSYYTAKQLKSFTGARKVAELLGSYEDLFYVSVHLHRLKSQKEVHLCSLLEDILAAFEINWEYEGIRNIAFGEVKTNLPKMKNIRCYYIPKQPGVRAKGCAVFEMTLKESYRISIESCSSPTKEKQDGEDWDVPF